MNHTRYLLSARNTSFYLLIPSSPFLVRQVHMSNVHARTDMHGSRGEYIRHHSVISPLAKGVVAGFGLQSYLLGLRAAVDLLGL